jgi:hypothetical protein
MPTITDTLTSTVALLPTPAYTVALPAGQQADLYLSMTLGEFAITVSLMLVLVPLVLLVFQNWGREISDRY